MKQVNVIRREVQWPYALAQLGDTREILSVAIKLEPHRYGFADTQLRMRVEGSVRVGLDLVRSMVGYLNSNGLVVREGNLSVMFTGNVDGSADEDDFVEQVQKLVTVILVGRS